MVGCSKTQKKENWIPEISGPRLSELFERIKPVVHFDGVGLCYIKPVHVNVPFLRNPERDIQAGGLECIHTCTTFHTFASRNYFNPTAAEVLAQIPKEYIDKIVAFEIADNPEKDSSQQSEVSLSMGYHTAKTRFYRLKRYP